MLRRSLIAQTAHRSSMAANPPRDLQTCRRLVVLLTFRRVELGHDQRLLGVAGVGDTTEADDVFGFALATSGS
jgi:hypothetical protein